MNQVDAAWRERVYCESRAGTPRVVRDKAKIGLMRRSFNTVPRAHNWEANNYNSNYERSYPSPRSSARSYESCDRCGHSMSQQHTSSPPRKASPPRRDTGTDPISAPKRTPKRAQSARVLPRSANDFYADVIRAPQTPDSSFSGSDYSPRPRRTPRGFKSDDSYRSTHELKQLRQEVAHVKRQLEYEMMERDRLNAKVSQLERHGPRPTTQHQKSVARLPLYKARDGTDTLKDSTSPWKEKLRTRKPLVDFY